jgi:hypothetical protein
VRHLRLLPFAAAAAAAVALAPQAGAGEARHFSKPLHVDANTAEMTGEPSIAVAPNGDEFIVAPDGPGVRLPSALGGTGSGGSLVWRSKDNGRTWTFLGSYDVPTGGGDSDITITPDGTLYGSGLSYVACSTVSRSTDDGGTWLPDPLAGCGQFPLLNDRQWVAHDGNDTVYTSIGDTVDHAIDLVRSTVTNPIVVPSQTMVLSKQPNYQWPGTTQVDQRNGTVYTVWNTEGAPNDCDGASGSGACKPTAASTKQPDLIQVSVLPRGSSSPPTPVVVARRTFDTFDSFVSDDVDSAGNVYVVWSERHPAVHQTWSMLSVSRNGGKTWSRPVKVNAAPRTTTFPWVTAGDDGRIAVSYYGTPATGKSPQTVGKQAPWYVYSSFSTDGGRSFQEYRTTGVMNAGPICTSGTGCPGGSRNVLDFFETAMDGRGCLVTSYADNTVDPSTGAVVSYVRQTSGPGLRAGADCSVR